MPDVLLVSMPFGTVFSPSIGLGLLKAGLADRRVSVRARYFGIRFAELVGQHFYCGIASGARPPVHKLAGEWIFADALFAPEASGPQVYVDEILRGNAPSRTPGRRLSPAVIERILAARAKAESFLAWCLDEVVAEAPRLVGFTSMFQQQAASLALARRIKEALPDTRIAFGGANCEGVMGAEVIRQFPFVDAVVSGEGDLVFPELVDRLLNGGSASGLTGVRTRDGLEADFRHGRFTNGPVVHDLDALPYPDYSDFFAQFRASRYRGKWQPGLPFETSRGCWWGERMHCTFCGLNGSTMAYRSKSARRALRELSHLTRRYPGCDVQVVDNILDMKYFEDFLPELASRRVKPSLFYETKANLKKDQVRLLRAAGIRHIQPGIESFSDAVLRMMRKGVTGLQNIQLLKWCKELGVVPHWNLLWGFPGEAAEEYARMAKLLPLVTHLPPPVGASDIRLDRFSPNFFEADRLGLVNLVPSPAYRHVYRVPSAALSNLAYYFAFDYRAPQDVERYTAPVRRKLRAWKKVRNRSDLFSVDTAEHLLIWDLRPAVRGREPLTVLRGLDRLLYQACDSASDAGQLGRKIDRHGVPLPSPEEIERRLEPLVARGLVVKDGSRYLALAVALGEYSPSKVVTQRFYSVARHLGRSSAEGIVVPLDPQAVPGGRPPDRPAGRGHLGPGTRARLTPARFHVRRDELVVRYSVLRRKVGGKWQSERPRAAASR